MESSESVDEQKKMCKRKEAIVVRIPGAFYEPMEERDCGRETRKRSGRSISQDGAGYTPTRLASRADGEIKKTAKSVWTKGGLRGGAGVARGWLCAGDMLLVLKPSGLQILRLQPPPAPRRNVSIKYLMRVRKREQQANEQDQERKYRGRQSPRKAATACHLDPSQNEQLRAWIHGKDLLAKKERCAKRRERRAVRREQRRRERQKEERAKVSRQKVKEWMEKKSREAAGVEEHKRKLQKESEQREQMRGTVDASRVGKYKGEGFSQKTATNRMFKSAGVVPSQPEMQNGYLAAKPHPSVRRDPVTPNNAMERRPSAPLPVGKLDRAGVPAEATDRSELQVDVKPRLKLSRIEQTVTSVVGLRNDVIKHKANKAGLLSSKEPRQVKEKATRRQDNNIMGFQRSKSNLKPQGKQVDVTHAIQLPPDTRGHSTRGTCSERLQKKVEEGMERKLRVKKPRVGKEAKLDPQLKHLLPGSSRRRGLVTLHGMKKVDSDITCPNTHGRQKTATAERPWLDETRLKSSNKQDLKMQRKEATASPKVKGKHGALIGSHSIQLRPDGSTDHCSPGASVQKRLGGSSQGIQEGMRLYERPEPQGSGAQELSDLPI